MGEKQGKMSTEVSEEMIVVNLWKHQIIFYFYITLIIINDYIMYFDISTENIQKELNSKCKVHTVL